MEEARTINPEINHGRRKDQKADMMVNIEFVKCRMQIGIRGWNWDDSDFLQWVVA